MLLPEMRSGPVSCFGGHRLAVSQSADIAVVRTEWISSRPGACEPVSPYSSPLRPAWRKAGAL